jgi:hypothetical protein
MTLDATVPSQKFVNCYCALCRAAIHSIWEGVRASIAVSAFSGLHGCWHTKGLYRCL